MASLLKLVSDVVDAVGLPRISAVASATDQPARQILALANEVLDDLSRKDWPVLERAFSFPTVVGQAEYALPDDYKRMIQNTMYAQDQYYYIRGSLTSSEWQQKRFALLTGLGKYTFKLYGSPKKVVLTPTPQVVEQVTFEYLSSSRVMSDVGVGQTNFEADTDEALFPDDVIRLGLKWKIRHAKGLEYAQAFNDYGLALETAFAQEYNLGDMPVAVRRLGECEIPEGYVPQSGYGA